MEIGDDTDLKLQILMDRLNNTISLLATKNYVDSAIGDFGQNLNIQNRVEQVLDAKTPSWSVIVSRVASLEGSEQTILEQLASIRASLGNVGHNGEPGSAIDLTAIYDRLTALEDADDEFDTWKTHAQADIELLSTGNYANATLATIYQRLDALDQAITEANAGISANSDADSANWQAYATYKQQLEEWKVQTSGAISAIATGQSAELTLSAIWSAISGDIERKVAAEIFAQASEAGSNITLKADQIDFGDNSLESRIQAIVNEMIIQSPGQADPNNPQTYAYLSEAGITFVDNVSNPNTETKLTQEDGLKHTITSGTNSNKHGYWLKPDGSGELALGKIKWTKEGVLTTNGLMLAEAEAMGAANSFVIDQVILYPGEADPNYTGQWLWYTTIKYRLYKSGFIVKTGVTDINGYAFANGYLDNGLQTSVRYAYAQSTGKYRNTDNGSGAICSIKATAFEVPAVNATGIITALRRDSAVWNEIFKYPQTASSSLRGKNIFNNGDSVYIQFPNEVHIADPTYTTVNVGYASGDYDTTQSNYLNGVARQLATEAQSALRSSGRWTTQWTYRYRGEYNVNTTYANNMQYKDVVFINNSNDRNNFYIYAGPDGESGIDPGPNVGDWLPQINVFPNIDFTDTAEYKPSITTQTVRYESRIIAFDGDPIIQSWAN